MKTFCEYWQALTPTEKEGLAEAAKTSPNYLSQIANGHRQAGISLVSRLVAARSDLSAAMIRPDLFAVA